MINKTVLQGRLTAAPELRQTQSGVATVFFTVAWSERYKEVEKKCFLSCRAWRGTAEFLCRYFTKGQELIVGGKLASEEWTAQDGSKRQATVLDVDEVHFCGPKREETVTNASAPPAAPSWETVADDVEIPF